MAADWGRVPMKTQWQWSRPNQEISSKMRVQFLDCDYIQLR